MFIMFYSRRDLLGDTRVNNYTPIVNFTLLIVYPAFYRWNTKLKNLNPHKFQLDTGNSYTQTIGLFYFTILVTRFLV